MVENLRVVRGAQEPTAKHDGHASCALVTVHGRMLLARFVCHQQLAPSNTLINAQRERYARYRSKRYGLPVQCWNGRLQAVARRPAA